MKDDIVEIVGCVVAAICTVLLMVLWCMATPDQYSAECEYARQQLQVGK